MSLRELKASEKVEMGWRHGSATDRRHRSKAWIGGLGVRRSGFVGGLVTSSFGGPVTLRIKLG